MREFFKARMTVLMPIFSTLAGSRTPEPLKAISKTRIVHQLQLIGGITQNGSVLNAST
ncbi:Uncharacterised protein [Yersinia wautersii]|uniref:Uncharacterized protein n=1 Tax=Yersinia wautersii TaxID=1341643 RepID=A0ABM9TJT3_9GAMM|nr:Uncharacterised protein [Yersinia wautersii]